MRAALVREHGSPEAISVETVPDPAPGAGEVLVQIEAVATNFVDLLVINGGYQFLPKLPFVPGKLPAGKIVKIGKNVTQWQVGDRVQTLAEQGGYATHIAVPADACIRLPQSMSFAEAAAMGLAYDTAWFALCERARARDGETMLVLGASGGVGLAAIQLGKAYGLKVLAGISKEDKRALVLEAGADGVVNLAAPDLRDSLRQQVHDQTGGHGADIVLDMLGGDFFDAAIRAVAWCGRLVVIGFAAGRIPTLKINYVMLKNMEVSGLQVSDYRKRKPELMRHCYAEIFRLFEEKKLHAPPTRTFRLEQVRDALRQLGNREVSGRVVLLPSEPASVPEHPAA